MQAPGTALLVEDEPQVAAALRRQLARAGFVVYEAHGERDAVRREEIDALRAVADPAGTVWGRFNLSEVLPEPTPMTWAIVRRFLSGAGGYGRMYADLGFAPPPNAFAGSLPRNSQTGFVSGDSVASCARSVSVPIAEWPAPSTATVLPAYRARSLPRTSGMP